MSTHQQLLYHIVFSTKHRRKLLTGDIAGSIYAYMAGYCQDLGGFALIINGHLDHVHGLIRIPSKIAVADFVGSLKGNTSKHINDARLVLGHFNWQDGYGAFTVSVSSKDVVFDYIANQAEHHRKGPFEEEYIGLLKNHEVEYDPRFVFD